MMQSMGLLRPIFTEDLAVQLRTGTCISLVSPHGQGRRRTLADLILCMPTSIQVLQANLRQYPQNLAAMLADLASQAGLAAVASLESLLDHPALVADHTLIILHNLDELTPGTASGYDDAFFGILNGIRERPGIALLCVCERMPEPWPLQLEVVPLPPLDPKQILAELARRHSSVPPASRPEIANWMAGQPAPYSLLDRPETWPVHHH